MLPAVKGLDLEQGRVHPDRGLRAVPGSQPGSCHRTVGLKGSHELCDTLALKIKALGAGLMPQPVKRKRKDLASTPPEATLNVERSIMRSEWQCSAEGAGGPASSRYSGTLSQAQGRV